VTDGPSSDREGLVAPGPTPTPETESAKGSALSVLEAHDLWKSFRGGDGSLLPVLSGVSLNVAPGEMVAVVGASGAGKSTLLHVMGALDRPTRGYVVIAGTPVATLADEALARIRNRSVGFVFQFHHLLREFSAVENVMMPLRIAGVALPHARSRAEELLARVGLSGRMHHRPAELSGGEQQRTAVARALAMDPAVLLADEPSGNLDHLNAERLHELFVELVSDFEVGMVVVTHNRSLATRAHRVLLLEDGRLVPTNVGQGVA
jgi:lipoprotein-releasing system ATP-binding protein